MRVVVFHGSPRKGNTYFATKIFINELVNKGNVSITEFFFPETLPEFCMGCQVCFSSSNEDCPHHKHVDPLLNAIIESDALIFTSPHYACNISGVMKNLFDHLYFLTMSITPRKEIFSKKAFIITTGAGSKAAIKLMKKYLKNWGINRVYSIGFRMLTDNWDKLKDKRKVKFSNDLKKAASKFYTAKKKHPYLSTIMMYRLNKHILKKYVGKGNHPY